MTLISFKNVGIRHFDIENANSTRTRLPIGIKTPIEFGANGEGLFRMHFVIADQIHDNLRNLILTNHGERVVLYDFGANLRPLLTEFSNKEDFDSEAMIRINTAVSKYMPFITLVGFDSQPEYFDNRFVGKIKILLVYSVVDLNIVERSLEVILNVI